MKRATVHVDLANKSCHITSRRCFYGSWGPGITRSTTEGVIAVDGWRFTKGSEWVMTIDGGTRAVERPGAVRRFIEHLRDLLAARASDRLLDNLGSATPVASEQVGALLLDFRRRVEAAPIPPLVDTTTAITVIHKGAAA